MILQFKFLALELTDSKLLEKFGTLRTQDNFNKEVPVVEPSPEIEDKESSATRSLSLPERGNKIRIHWKNLSYEPILPSL